MASSNEEIAALVIDHLVDIMAGRCSITYKDLQQNSDQSMCELLAGLLFLHEDLAFRSKERDAALERLIEQNKMLEQSRSEIAKLAAELSTPIIKVWDGVLMMPLVGSLDAIRARDIMSCILAAVVRERARHVIFDLTGVSTIDADTANHFLRIIASIKLLGAEGIVAGIQPSVSRAIVALGVQLPDIITTGDAQEALKRCMASSQRS